MNLHENNPNILLEEGNTLKISHLMLDLVIMKTDLRTLSIVLIEIAIIKEMIKVISITSEDKGKGSL